MSNPISLKPVLRGDKPPVRLPNYPLPPLNPYHEVGEIFELWTISSDRNCSPRAVIEYLKHEATNHAKANGYFPDSGLSRTSENEIDQPTQRLLIVASDLHRRGTSTFGCVNADNWVGDSMEPFFVQPCRFGDAIHALQQSGAIENRRLLIKNDPSTQADHRRVYEKIQQWDKEQRWKWAERFRREDVFGIGSNLK